ncbi:hypothetical protein [Deinococcus roseus]|uniref:MarR family transcriptional regulator n=1 Tax=Deinococcus roseus TaxID=392414 RepID=A0ABQ2D3Y9_9DEIO|nr:hypothetical protein [Deinococcus roseus]GGJ43814.1 hypothetical protein GCM10008938_32620 [Deinococcus roseus]
MSKLNQNLNLQQKVLEHLGEHTDTRFESTLSAEEIAAALGYSKEEVEGAIEALASDGLVDTTGSSFDGSTAHITRKGQRHLTHPTAPQGGNVYNNHIQGSVGSLQQGDNNTMTIHQGVQGQDLPSLIAALKTAVLDLPDGKREQALEQVEDIEEDVQGGKVKPSRFMAAFERIQALSGGAKVIMTNLLGIARLAGVEVPEGMSDGSE